MPIQQICSGFSHVGTVRSRNEDAWGSVPELGLWFVCDGMGGHDAGDYASRYIVERLEALPAHRHAGTACRAIVNCLADCNRHLVGYAREHAFDRVGSTVVVLFVREGRAAVLWAGDSRIYRYRNGRLLQITQDHSFAAQASDTGVAEDAAGWISGITRAVGADASLEVDSLYLETRPGDCWLLCSDGVSGILDSGRIRSIIETDPDPGNRLVQDAIDSGSRDNCTAVLVKLMPPT